MKVLCLHGRRQSGSTLARKLFDNKLCDLKINSAADLVVNYGGHEFVFINGPHIAQADLPKLAKARQVACEMYSWWSSDEDEGANAIDTVLKARQRHGEFDGILGFSQGGALAASFFRSNADWKPRVGIFLSAYYFDAFPLPKLIKPDPGEQPMGGARSLHVWGEKDQVVSPAKSQSLCAWMKGDSMPVLGGHAAPQPPWAREVLLKWLIAEPPLVAQTRL